MADEPPIERRGIKLTPGERFKNWVDSALKIWPLLLPLFGASLYGNSEAIQSLVHGAPSPEPVEVIPPVVTGGFDAQIQSKLRNMEGRLTRLEARSSRSNESIEAVMRKLRTWHE